MLLSDPARSDAAQEALFFLRAAHRRGHALDSAFFYHNGACVALNSPAALQQRASWGALSAESGLICTVCRSALQRRGVNVAAELPAPFRLGGLGDWLHALQRSDRVLSFGEMR